MIDFDALKAPFPPDLVSWRVGSTTQDKKKGMALAYIDARDVMERLDEVCGPENWQCRYSHTAGKTVCDIGICVDPEGRHTEGVGVTHGRWVWKADGAGDTDYEAEKGALSDAFKRAAVRWGIGRYLYDLPSPWVAVEQRGKSFVIPDSEKPKLRALLTRNTGPAQQPRQQPPASQTAKPTPAEPCSIPVPPGTDGPDWKAWAENLRFSIHAARSVEEVNEWMRKNEAPLGNLEKASKDAAKFIRDFADKKRAALAQAPADRKAS